jgi:histidinol-phosphate aminotransferase
VDALAAVAPYLPPRHPAPVDLLLAGNEGARPSAELLQWLAARGPEVLRRYPSAAELEATLAARLGVAPARVLVTAGGDEAIDRVCRGFLAPGRRAVVPQPTFVMLPHYAALAGAEIVSVPWPRGPYPLAAVLAAATAPAALIAVVTPNNPTGATATASDLGRLSAAAPHALLLVDLAYAEYADEDLTAAALALPNAIVIRTVSKAWGLAGLRVGYAVGPEPLIAVLRAAGGPFSVSAPSLALAQHALRAREADKDAHVAAVRGEREALRASLVQLGVDALPSQGNFVLARTPRARWLRDGLAGLGIAVRVFPEPDLADAVRITCPGDAADLARLRSSLAAVLRPQALLFDLDGVLADVSRSYRAAIAETAAAFGVRVTGEDIARAKAAGNANNDWQLTHRLIAAGGGSATLADVTARFEEMYQGTAQQPGLRRHETVVPTRALLERLAAALPLGIVTGRPRRDAERWLAESGLAPLFGAVACLEDGPLKPDPAPVRMALERLGVASAWLVGDTPDDVRAARAAGVVPLGIPAPGEDHARAAPILFAAGAARVLRRLEEIAEVLP